MTARMHDSKTRPERQENAWQAFLVKETLSRGGLLDCTTARPQDPDLQISDLQTLKL